MAEQSAFLKAYDEMQKKKGGFNAPAPVAPGFKPQVPQELSAPQVGPTLANEAQLPVLETAVQAPQELTADSFGPVAFPGLQQQGMDQRLQTAGEEQKRMNAMSSTLSDGQIQKEREGSTVGGFVENAARKGFDYLFGAPTAEQAQNTLDTMPTDPDQRARLQATAAGEGVPSDLSKAGSFLFGRPEVAGDPNILGAQAPAEVAASPAEVTPAGATPAGATPAVAAPVMDGSQIPQAGEEGFKFAERGSPQDYFLSNTNGGTTALSPEQITRGQEYAKQQGLNFDPTTGFSQSGEAPQVQAPQGLTTAGGQPLAEFLAGGQQKDAQGRMIDPSVDRSSFEQASADREARQAARPDFGTAVSDRDRRAARGDDISDADRSDIAKANQRGASAGDVARGDKVAAANGIDRKTGKPLEGDGLTVDQQLAIRKQQFTESEAARKAKVANAGLTLTPGEKKIDEDVASDLNDWRLNGSSLAKSNIIQLSEVIGDLEDGNIDTRSLSDFAPMSDNVRALFNPTGQDALDKVRGVIFQSLKATLGGQFAEKEGVRLVNAAYNTQLSEEQNIDRLGALLRRTQAAADAKDNASQYFQENGTLKGYSGVGARSAFDASTGAQGAKGSPIKGDVDVAGEADSRLNNY